MTGKTHLTDYIITKTWPMTSTLPFIRVSKSPFGAGQPVRGSLYTIIVEFVVDFQSTTNSTIIPPRTPQARAKISRGDFRKTPCPSFTWRRRISRYYWNRRRHVHCWCTGRRRICRGRAVGCYPGQLHRRQSSGNGSRVGRNNLNLLCASRQGIRIFRSGIFPSRCKADRHSLRVHTHLTSDEDACILYCHSLDMILHEEQLRTWELVFDVAPGSNVDFDYPSIADCGYNRPANLDPRMIDQVVVSTEGLHLL